MSPVHLPASARFTVFAPLDNGDRVRAVEDRLAQAIQLGLIADGEQLPSESELARQLGVAPTTLREALAGLRQRGLLETRRGRGGGSFVRARRDRTLARVRQRVLELTLDDLRDIGDRRAAIAVTAAEIAASRASAEDVERLDRHVKSLAEAQTAGTAQRADAHFHIELAATARSPWLTSAERALRAELGPLIALAWERAPAAALEDHRGILDAVRAADADAARRRTAAHVARETSELVGLHLELAAETAGSRRSGVRAIRTGSRTALDAARAALDQLFASVEQTRDKVLALSASARGRGAGLRRADLEELRSLLHRQLAQHRDLIAGAGVVFAPDALSDAPRWLEWWRATSSDHPTFMTVSVDSEDPDYYDFEHATWFSVPRQTRERFVSGPYVDYSGTDEHILTLTVPVFDGDRFFGVAGADVRVGQIEPLVGASLRSIAADAVLVDRSGRIIASNSPGWLAGLLLSGEEATWVSRHKTGWTTRDDGATLLVDPQTGWGVLTLPPRAG